jgi:hypothetical protein
MTLYQCREVIAVIVAVLRVQVLANRLGLVFTSMMAAHSNGPGA